MFNYKYKYLKYKLKYKKLINGGINNLTYKIAFIGCWNCSLKKCDKGNNTIATLDNIIKSNVNKTIFLGDNAYPNKLKLKLKGDEKNKKKFKYYTDELIYGEDNRILKKLKEFDVFNIKYLGIGNHDIEPEYDNKKILKEIKDKNINDVFILEDVEGKILNSNPKYLKEKSKNKCHPYVKLHSENIFAPIEENVSFYLIPLDFNLRIFMIDTNILTEEFDPSDCRLLYNNSTKDDLKYEMINELKNYIIYSNTYNLQLIITGHNPIISFKENELASNVNDFKEILDLIVEIGIKELIYISADTHNSQLCEFEYKNTLKIQNYISGNGGTDLDKTDIDETSRNKIIKNSDIEKISNIKITQFNDTDYGFLMLEIDENKSLKFNFKYN